MCRNGLTAVSFIFWTGRGILCGPVRFEVCILQFAAAGEGLEERVQPKHPETYAAPVTALDDRADEHQTYTTDHHDGEDKKSRR